MSAGFRRVGEQSRFQGTLINVGTATFVSPDGEQFERDVVHHPGAVAVVAVLTASNEAVLVRQYRASIDRELLEIVAGKRDVADEPAEETARRELIEEIGMQAGQLHLLAEFYNSPGFCDERSFVFLALDPEPATPSAQGIEEGFMTIQRVRLDDVPSLIASGEIVDAKTIIGLTLARDALARRSRL